MHSKNSLGLWIGGKETSRGIRSDALHRKQKTEEEKSISSSEETLISSSEMNGQGGTLHALRDRMPWRDSAERRHRPKKCSSKAQNRGYLGSGPSHGVPENSIVSKARDADPVIWSHAEGTTSLEV